MKGNIIGVKPVSFKKDGETIEGNKLYVIAEDVDCFGKSCSEIWVGAGTPLNKKLEPYFNDLDKLLDVEVEFSFKQNSSKVSQFEILDKPTKKAG
ncbi:MAG: hypothetical protein NC253_01315 [Ruminococcus sp.]|nr:hypothetical protein [Ruminococcus sp.]MCM1380936.1 hypothetical protein [Muribaculaceae bacterium]MCM1480960.1 hypothetical protein [Muribaculaceae bacterium]